MALGTIVAIGPDGAPAAPRPRRCSGTGPPTARPREDADAVEEAEGVGV